MPSNVNIAPGIAGGVLGPLIWYAVRGRHRKKDIPNWQQLLEMLGAATIGAGAGYYAPSAFDLIRNTVRSSTAGATAPPTTTSTQEEQPSEANTQFVNTINLLSWLAATFGHGKARAVGAALGLATELAPRTIAGTLDRLVPR